MTELPKEWIDKAENYADEIPYPFTADSLLEYVSYDNGLQNGFINGATAYKQAVDGLLKEKLKYFNKKNTANPEIRIYKAKISLLEKL